MVFKEFIVYIGHKICMSPGSKLCPIWSTIQDLWWLWEWGYLCWVSENTYKIFHHVDRWKGIPDRRNSVYKGTEVTRLRAHGSEIGKDWRARVGWKYLFWEYHLLLVARCVMYGDWLTVGGECCRLNVCVLSEFICWNLILNMMGFGKRVDHDSGACENLISILTKETPKGSLSLSTIWGHGEKTEKTTIVHQKVSSYQTPKIG